MVSWFTQLLKSICKLNLEATSSLKTVKLILELFLLKLNDFLEILECEDPDLDVLFDVKDVESCLDFAHLIDCYSDGEALILEFR